MVRRNDFLDAGFRHHDFIVGPQASVFEVLTLLVFEFPVGCVEDLGKNLGVLTIVFHTVVENGVVCGNEAVNDVGDRENRSKEFF